MNVHSSLPHKVLKLSVCAQKIIQRLKPSFSFMSILIFIDIKKSHNINCNVCRLHTAETSRYNKAIFLLHSMVHHGMFQSYAGFLIARS